MSRGPLRVWLSTARVGNGHVQAARALAESLAQSGAEFAVETLDSMELSPGWFRAMYAGGYARLVAHAPTLMGVLYDRTDRAPPAGSRGPFSAAGDGLRRALERRALRRFLSRLRSEPPDWIVHTHFLAPGPAADCIRRFALPTRQAIVVTDTYPHRVWRCAGMERYFVATDFARDCLVADGVAAGCIEVTGIPILARHRNGPQRADAQRELGWSDDRPALLLLTGSDFVVGPIEASVEGLLEAFPDVLLQVLVGHNKRLGRRLAERYGGRRNFRLLGYTEQMPQLLAAATLVLSKPGGLITSEVLAHGNALVCLYPVPGQESANADYLLENQAGLKVTRLRELVPTVQRLLDRPAQLDVIRANARRLAHPDAADRIRAFLREAAGGRT